MCDVMSSVIAKLKMAEYKFVKELPDDYLCMICAKVLNEPHLTDCCGQHFCQACLEQWFKKQQKKVCPHCRSENFSHISYIPLKRKINALEVYCPNQAEGCAVNTELGELNFHKNVCGFAKVVCTQGCRKLILRNKLTQHCNNDCSKRKIKCKYCSEEDHYETIMGKHTAVCKEYPVNCPKGCALPGGIKRKDLANHTEICPLERVQCPFNEAGCDATVLRKDLSAHIETSSQQHLIKMMTAYSKLKEDFKRMSSRVANLPPVEPVKLTDENDSFSFVINLSQGWISPPFCVPGGCTFYIKHNEGKRASLMLLRRKKDDEDVKDYKLEISFLTAETQLSASSRADSVSYSLANIKDDTVDDYDKEVEEIELPEEKLLNYKIIVKVGLSWIAALARLTNRRYRRRKEGQAGEY